jgi:hypothetical protein
MPCQSSLHTRLREEDSSSRWCVRGTPADSGGNYLLKEIYFGGVPFSKTRTGNTIEFKPAN